MCTMATDVDACKTRGGASVWQVRRGAEGQQGARAGMWAGPACAEARQGTMGAVCMCSRPAMARVGSALESAHDILLGRERVAVLFVDVCHVEVAEDRADAPEKRPHDYVGVVGAVWQQAGKGRADACRRPEEEE